MSMYQTIGKSIPRKDAIEKITGSAVYGADIFLPRMLFAAVCRSPHTHAKILSVDTAEAEKVPGVKLVLTGADSNNSLFGQFLLDQPILAFDTVRYEGEPVAAVAAVDMDAAMKAVKLIKVEYELLQPVVDSIQAVEPGAPLLHKKWSDYKMAQAANPVDGTNICDHFRLTKGDIEAGFAEADVIVENDYEGKMVQHTTIEPHGATVLFDSKGLTIWSPAQSPFMTRGQLAKMFHLSMNRVRIICTHIGGAFGCKYELKNEPILALLALRLKGQPIKLVNTRTEEFLTGGCRGPWRIHVKTGAKKDGTLVAHQFTIYWDTGAYATTGPRISYNACYAAMTPYKIPNLLIDGYTVVTNKHIATAYRGFGVPEVVWGYENQMDLLAEKLNMDKVELRLKNAVDDGYESGSGEILSDVGVKDCINEAVREMEWDKGFKPGLRADGKLHGRGIAVFCKLTGTPSSTSVIIKMNEDGTFVVYLSGLEMGQGATTAIPQIVAEALGVSVEKVMATPVDTLYSPFDKTTTSSRLTFHSGNAAIEAANGIKEQLRELAAVMWKLDKEQITIEDGVITGRDSAGNEKRLLMDDLGKSNIVKEQRPVVATGKYATSDIFDPPDEEHHSKRPTVMWFWGAQSAEVEVDPDTGKVKVVKFVAAHDIGKAINPLGVLQQIEGGVLMGLGHALLEEMIFDDKARLLNGNMVDFKLPTIRDAKLDLETSLIESKPHHEGPFGAKGIGEPSMAGVAAAIASAVSNAVGTCFTSLPIKADEVLMTLKKHQNQ
jgi:CO/xanthine dehydrogenase Mo-binding subunit